MKRNDQVKAQKPVATPEPQKLIATTSKGKDYIEALVKAPPRDNQS